MKNKKLKLKSVLRKRVRQILKEDFDLDGVYGEGNSIVKSDELPSKFVAVFSPESEDDTLADIIVETSFSGLFRIGRGTSTTGKKLLAVYSMNDTKEAIEMARGVLNKHSKRN